MKQGLAPVLPPNPQILILGSLPGDESLRLQQYYANPRNQFWAIIASVYAKTLDTDYASRLSFLRDRRIALWDVIQSADRLGSLDSSIRNETINEFEVLFRAAPNLRTIALNGSKAAQMFDRRVRPLIDPQLLRPCEIIALPSTSPIPGRNVLTLQQKIEKWRILAGR